MKCFLSHSSKDKGHYVAQVAVKLAQNIEYDEFTFEEGMGNFEEILLALERSDIFVLFISENSLNSDWVRREITEAKIRLDAGTLKRFFPIVIDLKITHRDPRIPQWISDNYNLRPIAKPTIAAKRIRERLVEASWKSHPYSNIAIKFLLEGINLLPILSKEWMISRGSNLSYYLPLA